MGNKRTQDGVVAARRERRSPDGRAGTVNPKFLAEREERINQNPLVAMNPKQKDYIELIDTKATIIATGYAGTSKTYIPTVIACDKYRTGQIDKIVFTRPNISNSKSLGYFGGDLIAKMENWLMPVMNILRDRLGPEVVEIAIKRGDIEFVPMEVVKGYSAENCFFIVDEAEDLTYDEAKKIVTRQGKNCKMVLAGDISQSELKEKSGLKALIDIANEYGFIDMGLVDFNNKGDIVRGEACKNWIIGFERWEGRE
tara:strand:+ start:3106 stop:3870 length:765 start_codon:yes stop_codon:yes gene_type:complete